MQCQSAINQKIHIVLRLNEDNKFLLNKYIF
jgi:hypothetical protein